MSGLSLAASNNVLDHMHDIQSWAPTPPFKLRLMIANGSAASAGTEVTGGSYTPQTIAFTSASNAQAENTSEIVFSDMPAVSVVGLEVWDSAGTPERLWWGPLNETRNVPAGGTLRFAAGEITVSLPAS